MIVSLAPLLLPATYGLEVEQPVIDYYRSGNLLWLGRQLLWVILPLIVLFSGLAARMRDWALRIGRCWPVAAGICFLLLYSALFLAGLPLEYQGDFLRQRKHGLSEQSLSAWLGDAVASHLLISLAGLALTCLLFLLIRKRPTAWWFYGGLLALPISLLLILAAPVLIDPLFHEFRPLKEQEEAAIVELACKAGIPHARVSEVRKGARTKLMNAYITGLGTTKRIVLWDTLLEGLDRSEVHSVVAHELGHYQLRHLEKTIPLLTLLAMALLYAVHRGAAWAMGRFRSRFGFAELGDIASLPLILLLVHLSLLAASPGILAYSRSLERQADEFALRLTGDGAARAGALAKLMGRNLSHPQPGRLYLLFRASHPPLAERIDRARQFEPPAE
jgi:STE24 endopeptidase